MNIERFFVLVSVLLVVSSSAGCLSTDSGPSTGGTTEHTSTATTTSPTRVSSTMEDTTSDATATTTMPTTSPGSEAGGKLFTYRVEQPPADATVINSTDPRVENSTFVQEILRRTAENGNLTENINGSQLDRLDRELEDVPYFSGGKSGYYLRYEGTVIRIVIARYQ